MKITEAKATELLKQDMEKFENAVNNCRALTFKPNENQFSALVSFAFNCGAGNLKILVQGRSAAVVAEKMLLYNKANGKVLAGLTRRRKAERELFLKGNTITDSSIDQVITSTKKVSDTKMPTIKKGSAGKAVKIWQTIIDVSVDGAFGSKTEKATIAFQKAHGLEQDGIVGAMTWKAGLESLL